MEKLLSPEEVCELVLDPQECLAPTDQAETSKPQVRAVEPESNVVHKGRILREDGQPLAAAFVWVTRESQYQTLSHTDAAGNFEIRGDMHSTVSLRVSHYVALELNSRTEVQVFRVDPWPDGEVKELRFASTVPVVVTIEGLERDATDLVPLLCLAPGEPGCVCDHRRTADPAHNPLDAGFKLDERPTPRRYGFLLAPGRYQLYGSNLMHELPWTEIELAPGEKDLEITIAAHEAQR